MQMESPVQQRFPHPLKETNNLHYGFNHGCVSQKHRKTKLIVAPFVYDVLKLTMLLGNADQIQSLTLTMAIMFIQ